MGEGGGDRQSHRESPTREKHTHERHTAARRVPPAGSSQLGADTQTLLVKGAVATAWDPSPSPPVSLQCAWHRARLKAHSLLQT